MTAPVAKQCCQDCDSGRTSCDESCIRATALVDCRETHGHQCSHVALDLGKHGCDELKANYTITLARDTRCVKDNACDPARSKVEEPLCQSGCKDDGCPGTSCQDTSCQDDSCQDISCRDTSCADTSCKDTGCEDTSCKDTSCKKTSCQDTSCQDISRKDINCEDTSCKDINCEDTSCKDINCEDTSCKDISCQDTICQDTGCEDISCKDVSCKDTSYKDCKCEDNDDNNAGNLDESALCQIDECNSTKESSKTIIHCDTTKRNRKAENDVCCNTRLQDCQDTKSDCCKSTEKDGCKSMQSGDGYHNGKSISAVTTKKNVCSIKDRKKTRNSIRKPCDNTEKKHFTTTEIPIADDEPCQHHLQQAFAKYASYLEKGKCICRDVLDRLDGCCKPTNSKPTIDTSSVVTNRKSKSRATLPTSNQQQTTIIPCQETCCGTTLLVPATANVADLSTCTPKLPITTSIVPEKLPVSRSKVTDPEGDAAREHVVLQVAGMTCTSCATKLSNVLNNVDGIFYPKVTFVTGTAEFDVDDHLGQLQRILPRLEKETGFTFSRIIGDHQTIYLVIEPFAARDALPVLYDVCESVEKINKTTYRISYVPSIIGARKLISCRPGISLAPPGSDAKLADGRTRLIQMLWSTSIAALLTIPVVVLAWGKTSLTYSTKSVVELILATGVQAIAIPEFYAGALKALIYSRVLEMDMLVVISITAAYGYSVVAFALIHAGYTLKEGSFFETSSLLITLVLLGRLIAAVAKVRAISAVSVRSLQAERAILIDASTGENNEIDARLLQYGDIFLIPPHNSVVTDGTIIHGSSTIDESMLTGESLPVLKSVGDQLTAGTINGPGVLRVQLTRVPGKNSITDIANLVENALGAKSHVQDLADRIAGYFVPIVVGLSIVVFTIWIIVAFKLRDENGGGAIGLAFTYSIAVLAISCPCALGLAVPMVLVIAGGVAARLGVIIKQANAIESASKITDVVFDKTGTLTTGKLELVEQEIFEHPNFTKDELLSISLALTKDNQHPVSIAISSNLEKHKVKRSREVEDVVSIVGHGIRCTWKGQEILAGNPFWLKIDNQPDIARLINERMTVFCVVIASKPVAVFGLKSTVREEASSVIADLHLRKITCHIVSGDNPGAVEDVANTLGIARENIAARHQPVEKQRYIERLIAAKKVVLFCGDGTNDAIAIAQANVGVQIGGASDITRATADVILLGGLEGLTSLLDISRRSNRRIIFNFVWSAIYNIFAISLAGGAFVKFRVPPAYAGIGEIVSVLPVVAIALTLLLH